VRAVLFWLHLAAGVAAGGVILAMSVTGVVLAYQRQATEWVLGAQLAAAPAPAPGCRSTRCWPAPPWPRRSGRGRPP
jgi:uncharacterized iron-regulated membrane protein